MLGGLQLTGEKYLKVHGLTEVLKDFFFCNV